MQITITKNFSFGGLPSKVVISEGLPEGMDILGAGERDFPAFLAVCDRNTESIAAAMLPDAALCVLDAGEEAKTWASVERVLCAARAAGLGRDGLFVGVGGGVVCDLTAFAASVYMRGAALHLVPTTLLAMVDAALGGKTGFDLEGVKNAVGTFYPADGVFICPDTLDRLPLREWKSGYAELLKTSILGENGFFARAGAIGDIALDGLPESAPQRGARRTALLACIAEAAFFKCGVVEEDPRERGERRALLNLGHTFGHALESAAGLGTLSHGEAVAWGIARACELGCALGLTPAPRAEAIISILNTYGYETRAPHPLMRDEGAFMRALAADKKRKGGAPRFVIPVEKGALLISQEKTPGLRGGEGEALLRGIAMNDYR